MSRKLRVPFLHQNSKNWQNLLFIAVFIFNFSQFGLMVFKDKFLQGYGADYLAFWSAGKIADEKGYAEIYDLENLKNTQIQEIKTLDILEKGWEQNFSPIPAPIFSFFIIPFQLLSRGNSELSYWIWNIFNLAVLIGYLFFFLRTTHPVNSALSFNKRILFLMLLSYSVIANLTEGQVEVFLIVCMGEFIRYALNKKPLPAGIWLGGLLLKPQLLIIVIPILFIQKNLKTILGFIASSGVIIGSSLILSGCKGMQSLISLWTQYSAGIASNAPENMINWRMVAVNLNAPFGWVVAILGMVLTCLPIYFLLKNNCVFGTPNWVMYMMGIFSATLAITWHSHYHMAGVLIPFLIYCSQSKILNEKFVFFWAFLTPLIFFALTLISPLLFLLTKIKIIDFAPLLLGFSGFCLNLVILISVYHYLYLKNKTSKIPFRENPPTN